MRVAVVTPYFKEATEVLQRCLRSVREQTYPVDHIVVADGHPQDWLGRAGVRHICLDRAHQDYGNTPRGIGGQLAIAEGYDAIAFLDGDNWYSPEHIATCVAVAEASRADYVAAQRHWVRQDGSKMPVVMREDADGSHVDTNCFFLTFGAFHAVGRWLTMPKPMAMFGDRFFLASLLQDRLMGARTSNATVNYLCTWADVFRQIGERPPLGTKDGLSFERVQQWFRRLSDDDLKRVKLLTGCDLRIVLRQPPFNFGFEGPGENNPGLSTSVQKSLPDIFNGSAQSAVRSVVSDLSPIQL